MGFFTGRVPILTSIVRDDSIEDADTIDKDFVLKNASVNGVCVFVEKQNERTDPYSCMLRMEPMATDSSLYCIRFATNHRSFALKKSCTIRSFSSFFAFQRFLLDRYPNALAQHLPPKHLLWVESSKTKVEELAKFMFSLLSCQQLMNQCFSQMFVQTQHSIDFIQDVFEGKKVPNFLDEDDLKNKVDNLNQKEEVCLEKKSLFKERKRKSYVEHVFFMKDKPVHLALEEQKKALNI